jgi:predicted ATPase
MADDGDGVPGPFLRRVRIHNYKSIGSCDVTLAPLTVLVGRNGSGKSNFLDALSFVVDGLRGSLDHAIRTRGGIDEILRRRSGIRFRKFFITLELALPERQFARYGIEIAAASQRGAYVVNLESLQILDDTNSVIDSFSRTKEGHVETGRANPPPAQEDRLYLGVAAGLPEFRAAYDALLAMGFYNLNPEAMKELRTPDRDELLQQDGGNIASIIARLSQSGTIERLRDYLREIVPGITEVERVALGPKETLRFCQIVQSSQIPSKFYASSMSDGTLRVLGALVAVTQLLDHEHRVRLVGIEEPETALHPAAAGALMDALREATVHTQILITSHSPDLLDHVNTEADALLVVESRDGTTVIAGADPSSLKIIKDHLFTPGDLLRMDQLQPDDESVERQSQPPSLISVFKEDL